jgi:Cellulase (glycosyl hydrolase family 5)
LVEHFHGKEGVAGSSPAPGSFTLVANQTPKPTGRGRARRIALLATCTLLAALAVPSAASATRGLTTGFSDGDEYQSADASNRNLWLDRTVDAGAGIVRLGVEWPAIAGPVKPVDPTNPASLSYNFTDIDAAVTAAESHGLKVLLSINHAPTWAEGPNRPASAATGTWQPIPSDVADFAQAVASRYSGNFMSLPAVQAIEIWDEPNSGDWLTPQFTGKTFTGAAHYREMLNASYKAIKSVNSKVDVVVGGTDPYGDPPGGPYPASGARSRPVEFWQQVLCVKPAKTKKTKKGKQPAATKYVRTAGCNGTVNFDIFAHHPIDNTGGGPLKSGPNRYDASTPDLGRVVSVLRGAEKAGTTNGGKHPVWVTEFWWDSKPPNRVGAPLATQARWIQQSMYLFWKAGASVAINFQIDDSSDRPNVHAGFQSGVYFIDGRSKPSLTAFRFPFVTDRLNTKSLFAWGKAPESGKLLIQRQQGSRWITVKRLQVSKGAVFTSKLSLQGKQRLRASVGSSKSLVWKQAAAVTRASSSSGPSAAMIALIGLAGVAAVLTALRLRARRRIRTRQRQRRTRPLPAETG